MNRLKEKYVNEIVPSLKEEFKYANVNQVPALSKIVVNIGCGDASTNSKLLEAAMKDLIILGGDTRTIYGTEAKYLLAENLYKEKKYQAAEKELLQFIEQSTPHAYWLARGFVLLSDVYVAMGKDLEARQYLLSLQQNYKADDDIESLITERLNKFKSNNE